MSDSWHKHRIAERNRINCGAFAHWCVDIESNSKSESALYQASQVFQSKLHFEEASLFFVIESLKSDRPKNVLYSQVKLTVYLTKIKNNDHFKIDGSIKQTNTDLLIE